MNLISATTEFHIEDDRSREDIDALSEEIADQFFDMEQGDTYKSLLDWTVSADLGTRSIEVDVTIEHPGVDAGKAVAISAINSAVKSAMRALNGKQEDLDKKIRATSKSSELIDA